MIVFLVLILPSAYNSCNFCNYNKDLFVVGNMTTPGNCCKKGTVYLAHGMCE